jgi:hypothetical protein
VGVASGLSYLHGQTEDGKQGGAPVYHRDIKVGKQPCFLFCKGLYVRFHNWRVQTDLTL